MGKIERLRACGRTCTQMMMLVCTSVTGARRVCSVHLMFAIVRMICFQIATSSSSICSLQQECLQSILARMLGKMGFSYTLETTRPKFWNLHFAPVLVPVSVQMWAKCQRKSIDLVKGTMDLMHWVLKLYLVLKSFFFLKAYRRASKINQTSGSFLGFWFLVSVKKSRLPLLVTCTWPTLCICCENPALTLVCDPQLRLKFWYKITPWNL